MSLRIVELRDEHRGWVWDSWVRSWRDAIGHALPDHARGLIRDVLEHGTVSVAEVTTADGPAAMGWCAWQPGQVHYCYVQHVLRRKGVALALLRACETEAPIQRATILTKRGRQVALALWGRVPAVNAWPEIRGANDERRQQQVTAGGEVVSDRDGQRVSFPRPSH